VNGLRS